MKSTKKDAHYTMVEIWKDSEVFAAHLKSEHYITFTEKAAAFMAAPMDPKVFSGEPVKV